MQVLYRFGKDVVDALNENNVQPPSEFDPTFGGGVIVMAINDKNRRQPPLAGSLNYNKDTKKWMWTDQLEEGKMIEDEEEIAPPPEQA